MFWLGLTIGLFVGCMFGFILFCFLHVGAKSDYSTPQCVTIPK